MERAFPIIRRPSGPWPQPVLVSIPHYGREALPEIGDHHYADPAYRGFPRGFTDAFAAEIYGDLQAVGATVVATPYSRLFVDVNRRREDFELVDGAVCSQRGVVRTHIVDGRPIFAEPLTPETVEQWLSQFYDPYHAALQTLAAELVAHHGTGVVLDAHTGSSKGMGEHEIVIGTRNGETADLALRDRVSAVFTAHGFEVHHDVPGYSGAYIVRRFGRTVTPSLHAIQVEINSGLLMTESRREYFARIDRGEPPCVDGALLERLRSCIREVVAQLGEAVRSLDGA